jgi:hypothetical protein
VTAAITTADVASVGWDQVNVTNSGTGGGASNALIFSVISGNVPPAIGAALYYVPVTPCRVVDTRNATGSFGGPSVTAGSSRNFTIPQSSTCNIPSTAAAYSFNVAVIPVGPLGFLTLWPTGQTQPLAATVSSTDGRVRSNAAIVPAGTNGAISVYASNTTDVVLDIDGYFTTDPTKLEFFPVTPCRLVDTRNPSGSFGGPFLAGNTNRILQFAGDCPGVFAKPDGGAPGSARVFNSLADRTDAARDSKFEFDDRDSNGKCGDCAGGNQWLDQRVR